MKDVTRLLDQLCYGKHGITGQLFLVNVHGCCEQQLLPGQTVSRYLKDLAQTIHARPQLSFENARDEVSRRESSSGRPKYLRLSRQRRGGLEGQTLHSTVEWNVFLKHCRKDGQLPESIPFSDPPDGESAMQQTAATVRLLTAMPGWHRLDATLGRPAGAANCWLAADEISEYEVTPRYRKGATLADRARDKLGLIHHGKNVHLVSYSFSGRSLGTVANVELARPTFADLGNRRYRAMPACDRSLDMSARGWGCTVHLGLVSQARRDTIAGAAERITRQLPLAQLEALEVKYLTVTTSARGRGSRDNDRAFLRLLLQGRSLVALKNEILRYLRVSGRDYSL